MLRGEGSVDDIVAKYNISSRSVLRHWMKQYNDHIELKDYDPKREVYMAGARKKTSLSERKEIVEYCLSHGKNYKDTAADIIKPTKKLTRWNASGVRTSA